VIKVWDVPSLCSGTDVKGLTIQGHNDRVLSLAFSPDSRRLASAGWDGGIKIRDAATARDLLTVPAGHTVKNLAFHPNGGRLASIEGPKLYVWNAETGERSLTLRMTTGGLGGLAYSPDGKHIAVGNWHMVRIWDVATTTEIHSFPHAGLVWSVAYSFDGRRIASGSSDQTVRTLDPNNGKELRTLRGHADRVLSVAFSRDGKQLASGSVDSTVRLWDAATGEEIATLRGHSGYVWSVAFSPDGLRLGSGGGTMRKVRLRFGTWHTCTPRKR
jgi:WD40 repeat protein